MNVELYFDKILAVYKSFYPFVDIDIIKLVEVCPEKGENYFVIEINNNRVIWFSHLKNKNQEFLEIPVYLDSMLDSCNISYVKLKSKLNLRVPVTPFDDFSIFNRIFFEIYENAISKIDFDCCSRFDECFKTKLCTHPNVVFSGGCRFRGNIREDMFNRSILQNT